MSDKLQQALAAIDIMNKGKKIHTARELALKRHQLQEAEFESTVQSNSSTPEQVEEARVKLVSLYEQYVDACLVLRAFSIKAEKQIDDMIKDSTYE